MIGYVTLGTNDLPRAAQFYDAIAAELGTSRMMDFETFIAWGAPGGAHCGVHPQLQAPAEDARLLLRLGARGRYHRPELRALDPMDFPAALSFLLQ